MDDAQFKDLLHQALIFNPIVFDQNQAKEEKLKDDGVPELSAAYLGPQIWNQMMMSDDLKLEAVDLDELFYENVANEKSENGDLASLMCSNPLGSEYNCQSKATAIAGDSTTHEIRTNSVSSPLTPSYSPVPSQQSAIFQLDTLSNGSADAQEIERDQNCSDAALPDSSAQCTYQPSITDVMISTPLNGQEETAELFDPRKRSFTDEELKPQPIIRKARKMFVADDCKDNKYWHKREKNNVAAKRSREARRIKENQIAMRANFLEKENSNLHVEVKELRDEMKRMMEVIKRYEKQEKNLP